MNPFDREGQDLEAQSTSSAQVELVTGIDESDLLSKDSTEVPKSVFDDERFTWEDASPQVGDLDNFYFKPAQIDQCAMYPDA